MAVILSSDKIIYKTENNISEKDAINIIKHGVILYLENSYVGEITICLSPCNINEVTNGNNLSKYFAHMDSNSIPVKIYKVISDN